MRETLIELIVGRRLIEAFARRNLAVILILCGVGLFVFGVLGYSHGQYDVNARLEAALGAVLTIIGFLLYRNRA